MKVEVVVPQIGEAVSELTLVAWLKHAGDTVKKGDILFEIDSDKAIVEVEAFVDGILADVLHNDGSTVMPQMVIAYIQTESIEQAQSPIKETSPTHEAEPAASMNRHKISPVAKRMAEDATVEWHNLPGSGPGGRVTTTDIRAFIQTSAQTTTRVNASPKAKQFAKARAINLQTITGTGVGGMIRVRDVEAALTKHEPMHPAPWSKLRQAIATRTQKSKQDIPHFYLMVDVNMTQVNLLRSYCQSTLQWERPPTYTDVLIRTCALALAQMPQMNQSYHENGMIQRDFVNIGVAVSTSDGLVVPVIPQADKLHLDETAHALRSAAIRAREGRLKPTDFAEKSMVISNLGMYSVDQFIAIIDQPDPMILAVGRVAERVVPINGQVVIQPVCTLSLSVDHRIFDGAQGAQFLEQIKNHLENPYQIL